ncbi:DNA-binding transcriptional regulator, AcrR family [Thermomonospora echinospora]|uniref:DNA-binding transcriptional regulator, AcrR family n=1 Tax=Thermomonospora echinospora TaxID=1992 RepID=A0A1H5S226_9ACTN|nr:TetR/AcrR family transcriptional regulator [Thermomonospora echinospora]SEF43821.1 DNA-binding transcriptional regulator, AcrR family [Thermomonospora echinospora]
MTRADVPARPGRPRSARAEKAILEATVDLLAEEAGVAAVSMEAVAARAGVGKTTIYRRWPNKEKLIVDALATLKQPIPELSGQSVREDLVALARAIGHEQAGKHSRCHWNLLGGADRYPELLDRYRREVIEPRREVIRTVLRRGMRTGELRGDLDCEMVIAMLVGSMTLQARAPAPLKTLPDDFAEQAVDALLHGIAT